MVSAEQPTTMKLPSRLGTWMRRNPVALKELRGRMRGPRAFVILTLYVALMSGFALLLYMIYSVEASVNPTTTGGTIGKLIFGGVVTIELFLVCFIAPAFTSGAISGERERRTFHILRTTLLSANRIVIGKIISALAYVVLLLFVAVPLQSIAFLLGGVTIAEVLISVELLVVTAIAFGVIGIFFSASMSRTLGASVVTYVIVLLITLALPMAALVFLSFLSVMMIGGTSGGLEVAMLYGFGLLGCTNPIATAILSEVMLLNQNSVFFSTLTLSNGTAVPLVSPWIVYTVIYLLVSVVLLALTVRRVRKIEV